MTSVENIMKYEYQALLSSNLANSSNESTRFSVMMTKYESTENGRMLRAEAEMEIVMQTFK